MIITIIEKKTKNVKGLEGNFMENHRKMSNKGDFYKNSMNLFPYFPFKIKKSAHYKRSLFKIFQAEKIYILIFH